MRILESVVKSTMGFLEKMLARPYRRKHSQFINFLVSTIWILLLVGIVWGAWRFRGQIIPYFSQINFLKLFFATFYYLGALIFAVIGWILTIKVFAPGFSWWTHTRIYLVTLVARRLPGTVWYIGGRMLLYKRLGVSNVKTSIASMIEMVTYLGTNCLIGGILLPLSIKMKPEITIVICVGALIGCSLLHPRVLFWIMLKLQRPLDKPLKLAQPTIWILIHIGGLIFGGLMIAQIISAFHAITTTNVITTIAAFAISGAAGYLTFFLPSSFGMSDITLAALLATFIPFSLAAIVAILFRILTTLFEVIFGLIFYLILNKSSDLNLPQMESISERM